MDWKENVRKYWWIGAILLVLLFILRPRPQQTTVSRMAAVEAEAPTSDGIMEQTLARLAGEEAARASRLGAAQEALALQQIKTQQSLLGAESSLQMSVLRGQQIVQDRLADKASRIKFQCPPGQGVAKLDPSTGQMFCRAKAGGGGFAGLVNTVLGVAGSVAPFFGAPPISATPPIAGNMPGLPRPKTGPWGAFGG